MNGEEIRILNARFDAFRLTVEVGGVKDEDVARLVAAMHLEVVSIRREREMLAADAATPMEAPRGYRDRLTPANGSGT